MGSTRLSQPANPYHREWRGRFRGPVASALSGAAYPPDVACRQFQLAGEGIFPLDAGGQLRMGSRLDSAVRFVGIGRRNPKTDQTPERRPVCGNLQREWAFF